MSEIVDKEQIFYHFDRNSWIPKKFNNRIKLNGFFCEIYFRASREKVITFELIEKINKFLYNNDLLFDFEELAIEEISATNSNYYNKILYELYFEDVRRKKFEDLPSRTKALFVVESKDELDVWIDCLGEKGKKIELRILSEIYSKVTVDAKWFEQCKIANSCNIINLATKYWESAMTENPKIEILVIGEFESTEFS